MITSFLVIFFFWVIFFFCRRQQKKILTQTKKNTHQQTKLLIQRKHVYTYDISFLCPPPIILKSIFYCNKLHNLIYGLKYNATSRGWVQSKHISQTSITVKFILNPPPPGTFGPTLIRGGVYSVVEFRLFFWPVKFSFRNFYKILDLFQGKFVLI